MNENEAWKIIHSNLAALVGLMVTVSKGSAVDVFCDRSGKSLAFAKPAGEANVKLCSVVAPDLEGCYGIHREGNAFVTDDGEQIPRDQLSSRLTQYITDMKDGGAEWGWEFKLSGG